MTSQTTEQLASTLVRDLGALAPAIRYAYRIAQADGFNANDYRLAGDLLSEKHGELLAEVARLRTTQTGGRNDGP